MKEKMTVPEKSVFYF